jgi:hypothetical protein
MISSGKNAWAIVLHGLAGWALCASTMGVGIATFGLADALILHAVAAPLIFAGISAVYFSFFGRTGPWTAAAAFLAIVVFMDFFVVAMLIEHSFAMFASFLGTWLPFALIFASTALTGHAIRRRKKLAGS